VDKIQERFAGAPVSRLHYAFYQVF